jgi:hypothetical protein
MSSTPLPKLTPSIVKQNTKHRLNTIKAADQINKNLGASYDTGLSSDVYKINSTLPDQVSRRKFSLKQIKRNKN